MLERNRVVGLIC